MSVTTNIHRVTDVKATVDEFTVSELSGRKIWTLNLSVASHDWKDEKSREAFSLTLFVESPDTLDAIVESLKNVRPLVCA